MNFPNYCFLCYKDFNRQLTSTVNLVKCFITSIYEPLVKWTCAKDCERVNERKMNNYQFSQQRDINNQLSHWKLQTLRQQNNTDFVIIFFIVLKIYAAIFCHIILFEDSYFDNFAKSCQYWTVYSVKLQAPGVKLTKHSLEVELTQNRLQRGWFPGNIPEIL